MRHECRQTRRTAACRIEYSAASKAGTCQAAGTNSSFDRRAAVPGRFQPHAEEVVGKRTPADRFDNAAEQVNMSRTVFWDVDTQIDFMQPGGKLYVPGAEKLASRIEQLTQFAAEHRIPIIASACAHV